MDDKFYVRNWAVLDGVIRRFEMAIQPLSKREQKAHNSKGAYVYIPLDNATFLRQLSAVVAYLEAKKSPSNQIRLAAKFIDIGCGIGTKVALARGLGFDAYGLEINPKYAKVAELLLGERDYRAPYGALKKSEVSRIITDDAFKITPRLLSKFDVVYFYCPRTSAPEQHGVKYRPSDEQQLEDHLVKCAKPGTVFLANLAQSDHFRVESSKTMDYIQLSDVGIWIKK